MFPYPYVLPVAALLVAVFYAFVGETSLAGGFFGVAVGLALWALGTERAIRPLMWFGAGIAAFAAVVTAQLVFFG